MCGDKLHSLFLIHCIELFSGVVFVSPSDNTDTLPNVVSYEIRQDAGYVTRTTSVRRQCVFIDKLLKQMKQYVSFVSNYVIASTYSLTKLA